MDDHAGAQEDCQGVGKPAALPRAMRSGWNRFGATATHGLQAGGRGRACPRRVLNLTSVFFSMGIHFSRAPALTDTAANVRDAASTPNDIPLEQPGRDRAPEPKQPRERSFIRRCPAWLGSCFSGPEPSGKNRPTSQKLAGARYAGVRLEGFALIDLRKGVDAHVGTILSLAAPGSGGGPEEKLEFFRALFTDVTSLLEADKKDFKSAFKNFADNYRGMLRLHEPRKEAENSAVLTHFQTHLARRIKYLEGQVDHAGGEGSNSPLGKAGGVAPPTAEAVRGRFDAAATSAAYNIVKQAHDEKWAQIEAAELASTGTAPLLTEAPEASGAISRPAAEPDEKGRAALRREMDAIHRLNAGFRTWLQEQNIEVVRSSGANLDCLLNAIQQHVTGAYHISAFDNRQWRAIVNERGALHSDTEGVRNAVAAMNALMGTDIDVVVVSTDEESRPRIISRTNTGTNPVVVWHQGFHYEALRVRADQAAAAMRAGAAPESVPTGHS